MSYITALALASIVGLTVLATVSFVITILFPVLNWAADTDEWFAGIVLFVLGVIGIGTIGWLVQLAIRALHALGLR